MMWYLFCFIAFGIAVANMVIAQVPVLCYHQVRNHTAADGPVARSITVSPALFTRHMQLLHDSGYQTILPSDLYENLVHAKPLPSRPVIISFDDNTSSQFANALPVLERLDFKAVFFVMTVAIDKPNYMTTTQLKQLVAKGHVVAAHTWDHKSVESYTTEDWKTQLDAPLKKLAAITGKPVDYFAYPYGSWNQNACIALQKRGIKLAFILHTPQSPQFPLLTVRRLMVVSSWSAQALQKQMHQTFKH